MTPVIKTQVYLPEDELRELHRLARSQRRPVAALIREAVRRTWLRPTPRGPVGIIAGPLPSTSDDHDAAFDEAR